MTHTRNICCFLLCILFTFMCASCAGKANLPVQDVNSNVPIGNSANVEGDVNDTASSNSPDESATDTAAEPDYRNPLASFLALGRFEDSVPIAGEGRPQNTVTVSESAITLPQGEVISTVGATFGGGSSFIDAAPEDVTELIALVETTRPVALDDALNPNRQLVGCDIVIVSSDAQGKLYSVSLTPFDDGYIWTRAVYEDGAIDDAVFLDSAELAERIKTLTGWRLPEPTELQAVERIVCYNAATDMEYELTKSETETVVSGISLDSMKSPDGCPFEVSMEFRLDNGEILNALWCGDSCKTLAIEGGAYELSDAAADYITQVLIAAGLQLHY